MPDISQLTSELRGLPDQALQQELQQPNGMIPSYLVLAEAQRRQSMRQAAQQQEAKGQSSTVLQDVVRNMMASQPPPGIAPAGMTPGRNGQTPTPGGMPTPTPPQPPPQGMRRGGRYAEGDLVDEDDDDAPAPVPSAVRPRLLPNDTMALPNFRPSPRDIDGWIEKYSAKHGVDPDMARAMMGQESGGQQGVTSPKGAHGLFQLMPDTAREMGVDPRIPEQNVEGGIKYYRKMLDQFGDPELALAGYNAGPGAVTHYGGMPPFPETRAYVPAIMGRYQQLKALRQQAAPQAAADAAAATTPPPNAPPAPQNAAPPPDSNAALQNAGIGALPDIQPPSAPADGGEEEPQPVFQTTTHPGRIHQNLADLKTQQDAIQKQLDGLQDPFRSDNVNAVRQNILTAYGLPPNYLESLGGDVRKATIRQYQEEAAARFHNPNPWEFLANISAGMGASKSLNFAGAFGEGVGRAWQARDQQQQEAFNEWNSLQKDADQIDAHAETARGRFDTLLNSVLTHQATINEAQRKLITDQLNKNLAEQDKWQKMLVPTTKFEAYLNPEDHTPEEIAAGKAAWGQAHGMNAQRLALETNAIQKLFDLGDPFVPDGPFATAYDQITKKHPDQAASLLAKPSKFSPEDIASYAATANNEPAALYDTKVVPKEATAAVRAYMAQNGMRVPVQPPNKQLHDMAASSGLTLTHANRIGEFAANPWIEANVLGPMMGRIASGEQKIGMDGAPILSMDDFPILKTATPQQTRDTQNLLTSLNYLFMREGKSLFGGRPPQMLMEHLLATSPNVHMGVNRFLGALDGVRASANMAIQQDRDWMYGATGGGTNAIPPGARTGTTKDGRRVMQKAPGQPWLYMDTNEEYKPTTKQP